MKQVWNIIFFSTLALGLVLLPAFEYVSESRETVANIDVKLHQPANQLFISKEDILQIIENQVGKATDAPIASINTHLLEESIDNHPFIKSAEVFSTLDGILHVRVKQKTAIARVMNTPAYYLDEAGKAFPTSESFSAKVPFITGKIDSATVHEAFELVKLLSQDEYFSPWLAEVHINNLGKFELIPSRGRHRVILGAVDYASNKFKHLKAFYHNCVNEENLNEWKTLDISYQNMLVSTKHE